MTDTYDLNEALSSVCQGTCLHDPDVTYGYGHGWQSYGDYGFNVRWNAVAGLWLCSRDNEIFSNYWLNTVNAHYLSWMPVAPHDKENECLPTSDSTPARLPE